MTNNKVKIFLLPWLISLAQAFFTIGVLAMLFPNDKLWLATLPIASGSFLAAVGYNIYELIVSNKK